MTDIIIGLRNCKAELETEFCFFFLVLVERLVSRNVVRSMRQRKNEMLYVLGTMCLRKIELLCYEYWIQELVQSISLVRFYLVFRFFNLFGLMCQNDTNTEDACVLLQMD